MLCTEPGYSKQNLLLEHRFFICSCRHYFLKCNQSTLGTKLVGGTVIDVKNFDSELSDIYIKLKCCELCQEAQPKGCARYSLSFPAISGTVSCILRTEDAEVVKCSQADPCKYVDGTLGKANRFFMTSAVVFTNCTKTGWPSDDGGDPDYGYSWPDYEYQRGLAWRHLRINARIYQNITNVLTLQDCFKQCVQNYVDADDGTGNDGDFNNDSNDPFSTRGGNGDPPYCKSFSWNGVEKVCSFHNVFVSDDKPVEWCWDSNYASGYYEASDIDY